MIQSATAVSTIDDPERAVREAWTRLTGKLGRAPHLVIAIATVGYALEPIVSTLRDLAGDAPIQGGTSCGGVMTEEGFFTSEQGALALFGLTDDEGGFGVGVAPLGSAPREAGADAVRQAMANADRDGEMPAAIWMITTPGGEEDVLRGIEDVVGPDVPIVGGSAADNTIGGNWRQFSREGVHENSVSIAVFYPSGRVSSAFHSGYDPTTHTGTITRAEGRTVHEIDGRPASRVYNEWTGGAIAEAVENGGELLARTNLHPLGRKAGELRGIPYFVLSHPERAYADGSMHLFTDVTVGESFVCMTGSVDALVERAGNVVRAAMTHVEVGAEETTAGLIIFCGGCFLTVRDRIDEVHHNVKQAMGGKPFLTAFTFGEQGRILDIGNRHGNLMISTLLFSEAA